MQSSDISFKFDFSINNTKTSYYFNTLNSISQTNVTIPSLNSLTLNNISSFFYFKGPSDQILTFVITQDTNISTMRMSNCFLMGDFDSIQILNNTLLPISGYYLMS